MKRSIIILAAAMAATGLAHAQDVTELEAQYKTCSKHYIPADKCTPEIYLQLKAKDNASLKPPTVAESVTELERQVNEFTVIEDRFLQRPCRDQEATGLMAELQARNAPIQDLMNSIIKQIGSDPTLMERAKQIALRAALASQELLKGTQQMPVCTGAQQ